MITTLDQKLAELLNNWQVNGWPVGNLVLVLIALVLSVILCGAIGIEREWRGRNAGLRTHLLVGVGSCIIMIISIYGFPAMFGEHRDVARLAAQIITGVGFLGAGVIVHRSSGVKGLTTAGTIWIVMAIGIACGSFNFIIAVASTIIIMLVLTIFKTVETKINSKNNLVVLVAPADQPIISKILAVTKEFDGAIHGLSTELVHEGAQGAVSCTFQVVLPNDKDRLPDYLSKLEEETKAITINLLNDHR